MELARDVDQEAQRGDARRVDAETLLLLLAPFAPFITEELWGRMGNDGSVHATGSWPPYDPDLARAQRVTIAITVNGKVRDQLEVEAGTDQDRLRHLALELPRIHELLQGREPRKVVAVVDRIVNIVV
jgi:leucyl-tRNA synthetase